MTERLNRFFISAWTRLHDEEEGQALTEYALVLALIVVGAVAILGTIGTSVLGKLTDVAQGLGATVTP